VFNLSRREVNHGAWENALRLSTSLQNQNVMKDAISIFFVVKSYVISKITQCSLHRCGHSSPWHVVSCCFRLVAPPSFLCNGVYFKLPRRYDTSSWKAAHSSACGNDCGVKFSRQRWR
jgi:hypothetical protein